MEFISTIVNADNTQEASSLWILISQGEKLVIIAQRSLLCTSFLLNSRPMHFVGMEIGKL